MDGVSRFAEFVQLHSNQLTASGVPELFWKTLCRKLNNQTFDAGDAFQLLMIDYGDEERRPEDPLWTLVVSKPDGIKASSPLPIYIIDHAWTYRLNVARQQLRQVPALLNRMSILMGCAEVDDEEERIEAVMESMWRYCQMYALGGDSAALSIEDRMPIWYIMDELGSGINHSDAPNCRVVPFVHVPEGITYSLLFPIRNCDEGDQVTRDFVEGNALNAQERNALLLPWRCNDFTAVDFTQSEPDAEYFLTGHIEESLAAENAVAPKVDTSRPLKVFTTYPLVQQFLTDATFEVVDNETDADVLWLTTHFKTFKEFNEQTPNKFINQFPFEYVLTIKDLLSIVCRRAANQYCDTETLETFPKWLPTTFNLKTELLKFVSYYQMRDVKKLDNHWIVKPWNLARGLDIHISKNLAQIVRLQPTGPKIVQKYIDRPVLFNRPEVGGCVKFDVRYVFVLKSVEPLEAYIYTNFFLRFANKVYGLDHFDDYEKHFTVMNYGEQLQLRHIPCAEFLDLWTEQYPKCDWSKVEQDIGEMLRDVLDAATREAAPRGIGKNLQSRALYAADIMLEWKKTECREELVQPKLLEINWIPDCQRACDYYPEFFNDIFKLLFYDKMNDKVFKKITL